MKTKGSDASLTILPVRLAGQPFDRVTEVAGLLLEQQGLKNIELGKSAFKPADKAGLETQAGAAVWTDRQMPEDAAFKTLGSPAA